MPSPRWLPAAGWARWRFRKRRAPPSGPLYVPHRPFSRYGSTPPRSPPRCTHRPRETRGRAPAHRAGRRTPPGRFSPGRKSAIPPGAGVPPSFAAGAGRRAIRRDGRGTGPSGRAGCTPGRNIWMRGSERGRSSDGNLPGSGRPTPPGALPGADGRTGALRRSSPRISLPGSPPGRPPRTGRGKGRDRTAGDPDGTGPGPCRMRNPFPPGRRARPLPPRGKGRATRQEAANAGGRSPRKSSGTRPSGDRGGGRRSLADQRIVAGTAWTRSPWEMSYPFQIPQEEHRAVHLMVVWPHPVHRNGMRYRRLYPKARW